MDKNHIVPSANTYRCLLRACTQRIDLSKARQVHAHIVKNGLEYDRHVGNALVSMLVKCGNLSDATHVFTKLPVRTVLSWSALISGYVDNGQDHDALRVYGQMMEEGAEPNKFTFLAVLKACGTLADLRAGRLIHSHIVTRRWESDLFVGTTILDMYTKCGSMMDAQRVFDGLPHRDVITWNAIITGYAQHGQGLLALQLYAQMQKEGVSPDARTFVGVAKAYGGLASEVNILAGGQVMKEAWLVKCKALHAAIDEKGCASDLYVANSLVYMYANCGSIVDARHVFDMMSQRTVVSWTTMIAGYVQQEQPTEALRLYVQMLEEGVQPNDRSFVSVLKACASLATGEDSTDIHGEALKVSCLQQGRELHAEVLRCRFESDLFVCNTLLHMYASCGSLSEAKVYLAVLPQCDVVSWNAVIGAYAQQEQGAQALQLYSQMHRSGIKPNDRTFVSVLKACSCLGSSDDSLFPAIAEVANAEALFRGKAVHAEVLRTGYDADIFISNTLLHFYAHCDCLADVQKVFYELPKRDVVSFSVMIAECAKQDEGELALELYAQMQEEGLRPDEHTFMAVLKACICLAAQELETLVDGHAMKVESLNKGKVIHAQIMQCQWESELFIGTTLVDLYANCGSMSDAEKVFDLLSQHDVAAINAMISGYAQQNQSDKALQLYAKMQTYERPSEATFVCILQACGNTGSLRRIAEVHGDAFRSGFCSSLPVVNSLVHAYSRCGSMDCAQAAFDLSPHPDRISWNTLIAGYARFGEHEKSLSCFKQMLEAKVKPDVVTFVSVLSACSHAGMVEDGLKYFESMYSQYNICPVSEHYASIIDLLGRAGLLDRVQSLLTSMTVVPNLHVWMAALGACRKFVDVKLGRHFFEHAISIEPQHSSAYILMANIYAHAEMWEDAAEIEQMRIRAGAYKKPGQSWIERKEKVHSFLVGVASGEQQSPSVDDAAIHELAGLLRQEITS